MTAATWVTLGRLVLSPLLLLFAPLSGPFYAVYALCGLTDMADGLMARRTHTETLLGARLDSIADLVFLFVCLLRLRQILKPPPWLWGWAALIALVRLGNLLTGYVRHKRWIMLHTRLNKLTGAALFLLPFTLPWVDIRCAGTAVCLLATAAALQEGYLIRKKECT